MEHFVYMVRLQLPIVFLTAMKLTLIPEVGSMEA